MAQNYHPLQDGAQTTKWIQKVILRGKGMLKMKETLSRLLRNTPLYFPVRALWHRICRRRALRKWNANGRPVPPPHWVKQDMVKQFARRYGLHVLVESGTFKGDMVHAMKDVFDSIVSIELSPRLAGEAERRFRRNAHIVIIQGDSGTVIGEIVGRLEQPALFWLDGHFSGGETAKGVQETPVLREVAHILKDRTTHVILIDDARAFGSDPSYPTVSQLRDLIVSQWPDVSFAIMNDCICIAKSERQPLPCNTEGEYTANVEIL